MPSEESADEVAHAYYREEHMFSAGVASYIRWTVKTGDGTDQWDEALSARAHPSRFPDSEVDFDELEEVEPAEVPDEITEQYEYIGDNNE